MRRKGLAGADLLQGWAKLGPEVTLEESMAPPMGHCPPGPQPAGRHRGVSQAPETAQTRQGEPRSPVRCKRRQSFNHMGMGSPSSRSARDRSGLLQHLLGEAAQPVTTSS